MFQKLTGSDISITVIELRIIQIIYLLRYKQLPIVDQNR